MSGDETIDLRAAAMTAASSGRPRRLIWRASPGPGRSGSRPAKAGLRFEAYMPPDLAEWLLSILSSAACLPIRARRSSVMLGELTATWSRTTIFATNCYSATVQAAIDHPRRSLSGDEVEKNFRELSAALLPEAAIWRKTT